jgi:hypothetical protein
MNKNFTIIFEKMDQIAQAEATELREAFVLSGEGLIELDELAELRRVVTEIAEPEPLSFTTT